MTEPLTETPMQRQRVLSGMRPTGRLHLGNYMGALYNWVKLQHEYECYFFIADWHALTTDYMDPSRLLSNIFEITVDFLSAGLDPEKCTIFVQSHVPQHAELSLLFGMFTPLGILERVPTYKDQQEQLKEKDLATYGFLGYPLLQSADILLYQPNFVPVGQDQVAHVELTREVARKFNYLYSPRHLVIAENGTESEQPDPERLILPEPDALLTPSPKLPGIDGRKMSKSYGNSILISDPPAFILEKMSRMTNGGQRNPQTQPGDPDICPVGDMHKLFSDELTLETTRKGCTAATIACAQCKQMAAHSINIQLTDIRKRREKLERNPEQVWAILEAGAAKAAARAEQTMGEVREVTGLSRSKRPVPVKRGNTIAGYTYSAAHGLTAQADWWEIDKVFRARNLRDHWRTSIVPYDVILKEESDRVFTTSKSKRVYVASSREEPQGKWFFQAKVKTYELLTLLCWEKRSKLLYDFVIPQVAYVAPWTKFKKSHKNEDIHFSVQQVGDIFELRLPDAAPIDITAYRGQYGPMA